MRIGVVPFPLGASFAGLEGSWRAAEEAGFDSLWTVDHATPTPDLRPTWEASSLLVAMAARTQTIPVGVLVFDVLLRHPFILAGSIAVAQAMSRGRVRVGLGVGDRSSRPIHGALDLPFPPFTERVQLLEAMCTALPALWRGETISDASLGLIEVGLGPVDVDLPPLIVGGKSLGLMEVAARHAWGWNVFTQEPEEFAKRAEMLAGVEAAAPHREPLQRSVYLFAERVKGDLRDTLKDFEAAGADEAMVVVMKPSRDAIFNFAQQIL